MTSDHDAVREVPMFPLGTVLLPGGILPLHVFEDRYRELTEYCLGNQTSFGVVLIERGHEVGGGDVRASVGGLTEIIQHERLSDGRSNLVYKCHVITTDIVSLIPKLKLISTFFEEYDTHRSTL